MVPLKRSELRTHLLRSVQILKRSLDYTAYCYFILAMLFFHFAAQTPNSFGNLSGTPHIVAAMQPTGSRIASQKKKWKLQDDWGAAFSGLEENHPLLKHVLSSALPKIPLADEALLEYQHDLDRLQAQTGVFSSPERFSQAYEYWIEQLATLTTKRGISFYTQRSLVRLMIELIKPQEGMSVYDPTVGTAGMLIESARYVEQHRGSAASMQLYGRELASNIWAIGRMNLLAHGLSSALIEQADTLASAQAPGTFDLVLQELPLAANTRSGHLANAAFLKHALQALRPQGRAAVLSPSSLLQYDHGDFWRSVLSRDWLESVIALPPKLLQGTPSSAYLLIFNKQKAEARQGQVLFIQADPTFVPTTRYNQLADARIQNVVQIYDRWQGTTADSRIVSVDQIEAQNYRLNVDRYLELPEAAQNFNLTAALSRYRYTAQKREAAVEKLMRSLAALDDEAGEGDVGSI